MELYIMSLWSGKNLSDERNIPLAYREELYPMLELSLFMVNTLLEILKFHNA
jgi:hypothetical protein